MKTFSVEIVETLCRVVDVEANSYEEARDEVAKMYDNEEIVLDFNDLVDHTITTQI